MREQLEAIRSIIEEWNQKEGHDRCWYYPSYFERIASILGIKLNKKPSLPSEEEFKQGCEEYRKEQYE